MQSQTIFSLYSKNLDLVVQNGILQLDSYKAPLYICPICLTRYSTVEEHPDNPLTLEDAPPKSLGGKPVVLTCKKCNNTAGYKIDVHLVNRLRELDDQQFLPGTDLPVTIKIDDETFRAKIQVDEKGTMSVLHSNKNNHPEKLQEAMKNVTKGMRISPEFIKTKVIPENLEYALLKTGYILAFAKYGYSLMLDPCYDIVREQLLNPEMQLFPVGFWLSPREEVPQGVFMITDKGYESIVIIFFADTGKTKHNFVVILPLPIRPIQAVITAINYKMEQTGQFGFNLYPKEQVLEQFLLDLGNIKAMRLWIAERTSGWKP